MKHFPFGSSTAARTDECQQWRGQSEGVPRQESSFATDGTTIHGILEAWDLDEGTPKTVEGHPVEKKHVDMANVMRDAADRAMTRHGVMESEPEVTGTVADDIGGTLDLVGLAGTTLVLLDYKTGQGVQVSPVNNKQILFAAAMIMYGESSVSDWAANVTDFVGVIVQPDRAGDVEAREWAFTMDQVTAFWDNHLQNIERARKGEGELKAGDHCKFCPANGLCDATTGNLLRMQQLDPEDAEQLRWALSMIEQVKTTITAVEALALQQLEVGVEIPGWKLVAGRPGNTTWDDPETALKTLKKVTRGLRTEDDVRVATLFETRKLITPTQAKKLLKEHEVAVAFLDEITHRPDSRKLTLAKESDKRPAILSPQALAASLNSVTS